MYFFVKISSKNKETLKLFLIFLSKFDNNNLNLIIKYFPKQKIKKFITVLKSPHVNKSAQEQFEFRIYTKKLFIFSTQHLKFLYFIKKLQNSIFPFIKLKIEGCYNEKVRFNSTLNQIEPNTIKFNFLTKPAKPTTSYYKLFTQYCNLLDYTGEYSIKHLLHK